MYLTFFHRQKAFKLQYQEVNIDHLVSSHVARSSNLWENFVQHDDRRWKRHRFVESNNFECDAIAQNDFVSRLVRKNFNNRTETKQR